MTIKELSILGFRGFSQNQHLELAIPDGKSGSGLTVLVGPNNSGKSTIIESFKYLSLRNATPSFADSKRNKKAGDKIAISLKSETNGILSLRTQSGSSESTYEENDLKKTDINLYVLPSRRAFSPFFGKNQWNREAVINNSEVGTTRAGTYSAFEYRIFDIQKNPEKYNEVLGKVLGKVPVWTIDQSDTGQYFIKFNYNGDYHNSDGAGEGLLSVYTIVETLFDSKEGDTIVIDEPELSLHPALQKKVLELLMEYSKDRQIIISTHSPFFIDWESLINGGKLVRVIKETDGIKIYPIHPDAPKIVEKLTSNLNNPHILGLDAKEIFFLDDDINIVEGQEDVIFYKKIFELLKLKLNGTFYGWGIGGSGNLDHILKILQSLGFKKINCILDNDMKSLKETLEKEYPEYSFVLIPTNDVRDKEQREIKAKEGLISSDGKTINSKYAKEVTEIVHQINKYFN
ncbi:MAG: ATP-binding protein [Bacteroidota bacterium]